jgi:hypothetical protein
MRRLGLDPLADENLEPPRGSRERVSFGHEASVLALPVSEFCRG